MIDSCPRRRTRATRNPKAKHDSLHLPDVLTFTILRSLILGAVRARHGLPQKRVPLPFPNLGVWAADEVGPEEGDSLRRGCRRKGRDTDRCRGRGLCWGGKGD